MNIQTLTVTVSAPREVVFNFFADIENLPKWAVGYCERVTLQRGGWWALTAEGDQTVAIDINADSGVVDLRSGHGRERVSLVPIRIVALEPRLTLVSVTLIDVAGLGAESFSRRCRLLREALKKLPVRFGGGELHAGEPTPQLLELGLN